MAIIERSAHWCNRLGKLAESQHTSYMTQLQTEREAGAQSVCRRGSERQKERV